MLKKRRMLRTSADPAVNLADVSVDEKNKN